MQVVSKLLLTRTSLDLSDIIAYQDRRYAKDDDVDQDEATAARRAGICGGIGRGGQQRLVSVARGQ